MSEADLFPLRQLINAGGGKRDTRERWDEHADAHGLHRHFRDRHADDVRDRSEYSPHEEISGKQQKVRSARAIAAIDARLNEPAMQQDGGHHRRQHHRDHHRRPHHQEHHGVRER